jgi:adenylate cyclase class 1
MENAAISRIVSRNKRRFLKYNQFRKQLFAELAPKESEAVVYLLPWLLSVNDPRCPGYLDDTTARFRVFGVDNEREIRRREPAFKRLFGVEQSGSLLRLSSPYYLIEGLYTIGSTGTVSQVPGSDCDIWICFDKRAFDPEGWRQLSRKVNLIKDWLDGQYKMPIYFFISDVAAILESRFGSVDQESSGSTQRNVLKEEFYRTFILICGKVPLWWVCQDQEKALDYPTARRWLTQGHNTDYDLIDLGDLNRIERSEYLGAALWQFHKALTHPLKSILKMILLKMLLEAPEKRLLCHRFREAVLGAPPDGLPPDQSLFAMAKALEHIGQSEGDETVAFLKECFHLRCRIDPYNRRQPLKNHLASAFFKEHSLVKAVRNRLRRYDTWEIGAQIDFGNRLFRFLAKIYREMAEAHAGAVSDSDQRDLTILGRKISAGYLAMDHKIPVLHKPTASINLSHLTLSLEHNLWHLYPGNNYKQPLASHADVFWLIGFMVFNGLFAEHLVRMRPNASSLTLQEVLNLSRKIREIFGTYDRLDIPYGNYLTPERVSRLLIVVGF